MPDPQRKVCSNISERLGACLFWMFIACATAYGLLLLIEGVILAAQSR